MPENARYSPKEEQELFDKIIELFKTGEYGISRCIAMNGVSRAKFYEWLVKKTDNTNRYNSAKSEFRKNRALKTAQAAEKTLQHLLKTGFHSVKKEYTVQTGPNGEAIKTLVREIETTGPPPSALVIFAISRAQQAETESEAQVVDFNLAPTPDENGSIGQESE
jgi:hypothetical protein